MDKQKTESQQSAKLETHLSHDARSANDMQDRQSLDNPQGFADEAEPAWAPPESQPEPLTSEPVMKQNQPAQSSLSSNTNSPT